MNETQQPARLSEENLRRIEELKKRYPHPQAVVLEALWMWQGEHGWISEDGMRYIARLLSHPRSPRVRRGVLLYDVQPCSRSDATRSKCARTSRACCGTASASSSTSRTASQIKVGETTPDRRFTLVEAECLGSCGTAPVMQIGDRYYENLDPQKVDAILEELK